MPPTRQASKIPLTERDELAAMRETEGDAAASRRDRIEALSCWSEALVILQERQRAAEIARVATKMAAVEEALGQASEAGLHYKVAADAYVRAGEPELAPMCLNNLAMLRKLSGTSGEAAEILRSALELGAHLHGENHREMALIMSNLGAVLAECGDLPGAIQAHMKALGVREYLYGPAHPEVGLSMGHLAVAYQLAGEEDKARCHYEAALAILSEFPGVHSAEGEVLRSNLAELNGDAGEG